MYWKLKKCLVAVLGFLFQPLGMLYVVRSKWALIYLLSGALVLLADKYLLAKLSGEWINLSHLLTWGSGVPSEARRVEVEIAKLN